MDIIVSHESIDFDGLASAVAAQRLYPGARIVIGRSLSPEVRDFLTLHKDRFETIGHADLDQEAVTRMIVVDVRRAGRLKALGVLLARRARRDPTLELHIYDHHGPSSDDLAGDLEHIELVGSTTTLFIELIRARGVEIDAVEATLFVLGIYADTGSLSYGSTQPRDAAAAAWLLEQGGNLDAVRRYLTPPLSSRQRRALIRLLGAVETESVGAVDMCFAVAVDEDRCPGLANVATKILEFEGKPALFVIHAVEGRHIDVIGRASVPWIDVGRILQAIGGGGHPAAGSAIVKGAAADPEAVKQRLLEVLHATPPRPERVHEVMSAPVRWVKPDTPLAAIEELLESWEHTGVPVVQNGEIVGIISRRDLRKAARSGRMNKPASSCMSRPVTTVPADAPLELALEAMRAADVGRLPVLRDGRLVGIVTRSDLLRHIYGDRADRDSRGRR